jgi:hypothetical protein
MPFGAEGDRFGEALEIKWVAQASLPTLTRLAQAGTPVLLGEVTTLATKINRWRQFSRSRFVFR